MYVWLYVCVYSVIRFLVLGRVLIFLYEYRPSVVDGQMDDSCLLCVCCCCYGVMVLVMPVDVDMSICRSESFVLRILPLLTWDGRGDRGGTWGRGDVGTVVSFRFVSFRLNEWKRACMPCGRN